MSNLVKLRGKSASYDVGLTRYGILLYFQPFLGILAPFWLEMVEGVMEGLELSIFQSAMENAGLISF